MVIFIIPHMYDWFWTRIAYRKWHFSSKILEYKNSPQLQLKIQWPTQKYCGTLCKKQEPCPWCFRTIETYCTYQIFYSQLASVDVIGCVDIYQLWIWLEWPDRYGPNGNWSQATPCLIKAPAVGHTGVTASYWLGKSSTEWLQIRCRKSSYRYHTITSILKYMYVNRMVSMVTWRQYYTKHIAYFKHMDILFR